MRKISRGIEKVDLSEKSNKELAGIFKEFVRCYFDVLVYGWLPVASEGFSSEFSGLLKKYLSKQLSGSNERINDYFIYLTTPRKPSLRQKAEKEVSAFINFGKKSNRSLERFVKNYLRKYQWINYDFQGPVLSRRDVLNELKKVKKEEMQKRIRMSADFLERNPLYRRLFETAKEFMYIKNRKQEIFFYSHFCLTKLFSEIGRRQKLTLKEVRSMLVEETIKMLEKGELDKSEIKIRSKRAIFVFAKDKLKIVTDKKELKDFLSENLIREEVIKTKELRGQIACRGRAKGLAKVINSNSEMEKMQKGNILVSSKTNPNFMGAIKKAAAIITDYGGITCHAAIVSRELDIPCIIGTKIATKVMHDGDLVEVDADRGIVKIIKKSK